MHQEPKNRHEGAPEKLQKPKVSQHSTLDPKYPPFDSEPELPWINFQEASVDFREDALDTIAQPLARKHPTRCFLQPLLATPCLLLDVSGAHLNPKP